MLAVSREIEASAASRCVGMHVWAPIDQAFPASTLRWGITHLSITNKMTRFEIRLACSQCVRMYADRQETCDDRGPQ